MSRFLKHFYTWAVSSQSEDALNHSRPIIMTGDSSRIELEREYVRHIVAQSLTVWNGLTKAVEKDETIADIVVQAKAPSEAWKILKSMVEDDSSERAKEQAKKHFDEGLSMDDAETMKEYIARAKSQALNVQYHDIEVSEEEINHRVLNGLHPLVCSREEKVCFENTCYSSRTGGWSRSRGGAQQELGRDRRQPCPGRWLQSQKRRAERGTWRPQ